MASVVKDTASNTSKIFYYHSDDLKDPVTITIKSIEGNLEKLIHHIEREWYTGGYHQVLASEFNHDLFVTVELYYDGKLLTQPLHTGFGRLTSSNQYRWEEVHTFPIKYCDLPLNAEFVFTLWDIIAPKQKIACGGCALRLFTKRKRTLRKGRHKLHVRLVESGDIMSSTSFLGDSVGSHQIELDRIEKLLKKYEQGQLPQVDWIDKLALRALEKINSRTDLTLLDRICLHVELRTFDYPVVFHSPPYPSSNKTQILVKTGDEVIVIYDPELNTVNPVEEKHLKLSRKPRGPNSLDHDLKPNNNEQILLKKIIAYAPTKHLTPEEKELIWKFRYYLRNTKKALTKFLKCVDWSKPDWSTQEALRLLREWEPPELDDTLELLSHRFRHIPQVRAYAVQRLQSASEEELICYLLQLVQVLRYDKTEPKSDLATFLIHEASTNPKIANYLYWYLSVECNDEVYKDFYKQKLNELTTSLSQTSGGRKLLAQFEKQELLIRTLTEMCRFAKKTNLSRNKKMEKLKELVKSGKFSCLHSITSQLPLPLNFDVVVTGIKPDIFIFKSSMAPIKVEFECENGPYSIMFKLGDDMRQDQLVVQLISLMDRLLKKENLDLKLTPYRVLATSNYNGMLELVKNCKNIADVLKDYDNDIKKFLRYHNPDPSGPYGIKAEVLKNFVKSCAGYCVITYILGIGDRHLDNLLITYDGRLFHVDFGFILGRDPKPFPPPMKLCSEMVEGMGGQNSPHYNEFKQYCCEAYNILRKSANLILNLFSLMIDANIQDINQGEKSVLKVQEKFKLDLTDEEATLMFQALINDSVRALFPQIAETMHRWKKYWQS